MIFFFNVQDRTVVMCYFGILWIIKGLNSIVKETYKVRAILIYLVYQPAAILTVSTLNLFCGTYTLIILNLEIRMDYAKTAIF